MLLPVNYFKVIFSFFRNIDDSSHKKEINDTLENRYSVYITL